MYAAGEEGREVFCPQNEEFPFFYMLVHITQYYNKKNEQSMDGKLAFVIEIFSMCIVVTNNNEPSGSD